MLAALTASVTSPGMSRELLSSELIYTPLETLQVEDEELKKKLKDLVEAIEEEEDTVRVWTTMNHCGVVCSFSFDYIIFSTKIVHSLHTQAIQEHNIH